MCVAKTAQRRRKQMRQDGRYGTWRKDAASAAAKADAAWKAEQERRQRSKVK